MNTVLGLYGGKKKIQRKHSNSAGKNKNKIVDKTGDKKGYFCITTAWAILIYI